MHGIVVMYAVDDRDSLEHVEHWMEEIDRYSHDLNAIV